MLNFREELSKIFKTEYTERVMEECFQAVLSVFKKMKVIKPVIFYFYNNAYPKISIVKEEKGRPIIWEKEFKTHEEVNNYLILLKKYFKEQGYEIEEYYGTMNFRVKIEP